jgi:hypothetical protein
MILSRLSPDSRIDHDRSYLSASADPPVGGDPPTHTAGASHAAEIAIVATLVLGASVLRELFSPPLSAYFPALYSEDQLSDITQVSDPAGRGVFPCESNDQQLFGWEFASFSKLAEFDGSATMDLFNKGLESGKNDRFSLTIFNHLLTLYGWT